MPVVKEDTQHVSILQGPDNFPTWRNRVRGYLKVKKLWEVTTTEPTGVISSKTSDLLGEAAWFITSKISDKVHNTIITTENENNAYLLWNRINEEFAKSTPQEIDQVLQKWNSIKFNGMFSQYLNQVEGCLMQFTAIGFEQNGHAICPTILSKIEDCKPGLTTPLTFDKSACASPTNLINKLKEMYVKNKRRDVGREEAATPSTVTGRTKADLPSCKNGKHNTAVTTHSKDQCWAVHPELRPIRRGCVQNNFHHAKVRKTAINNPPGNDKEEVPQDYATPAFAAFTTMASSGGTTILNSGASHHMLNSLNFFSRYDKCRIPIGTGKSSNKLLARCTGVSKIQIKGGRILTLHGLLFVPGLTRNLVLLGRLLSNGATIKKVPKGYKISLGNGFIIPFQLVDGIFEIQLHASATIQSACSPLLAINHFSGTTGLDTQAPNKSAKQLDNQPTMSIPVKLAWQEK